MADDLANLTFFPVFTNPALAAVLATSGLTQVVGPVVPTVSTSASTTAVAVPGFTGRFSAKVVTGLGAILVVNGPGVLHSVFFATQNASTAIITIYDQNLQFNSGRMIGYFAGNQTLGTVKIYDVPFQYGIMINQAVSSTTLTIVYTV